MLLSRSCQYALQALLYIAEFPKGKYIRTREIAEQCNLSYHFLGKALQAPVKNRLLASQKGRAGGYTLAKLANEITLLEVIHAIEGADFLEGCVLGSSRCSDTTPCPVRHQWVETKEEIHHLFGDWTVAQLLDVARQRRARNTPHFNLESAKKEQLRIEAIHRRDNIPSAVRSKSFRFCALRV